MTAALFVWQLWRDWPLSAIDGLASWIAMCLSGKLPLTRKAPLPKQKLISLNQGPDLARNELEG